MKPASERVRHGKPSTAKRHSKQSTPSKLEAHQAKHSKPSTASEAEQAQWGPVGGAARRGGPWGEGPPAEGPRGGGAGGRPPRGLGGKPQKTLQNPDRLYKAPERQ